jgi:hypothetical protein
MAEFEIASIQYQSTKLPVMRQVKLMKRISPLMGREKNDIGFAISEMPDSQTDFIIAECLGSCERKTESGSWAKVWNEKANRPMFDDIELMELGQIVWAVLQDNFGAFLQGNV